MNIAVLGTGIGRPRDRRPARTSSATPSSSAPATPRPRSARTEPDGMGNPPFAAWHAEHTRASRWPPSPTPRPAAELVVNATGGGASLDVLGLAGADNLAGKVLLDIANPLDFSQGFPPTLFVKDTDSLGEQIQRAFPEARVVKTLNTLTAALMVDPQRRCGESTPSSSPATTPRPRPPWRRCSTSFGHDDVIDLGDSAPPAAPRCCCRSGCA